MFFERTNLTHENSNQIQFKNSSKILDLHLTHMYKISDLLYPIKFKKICCEKTVLAEESNPDFPHSACLIDSAAKAPGESLAMLIMTFRYFFFYYRSSLSLTAVNVKVYNESFARVR